MNPLDPAALERHARSARGENLLAAAASILLGIAVAALVVFMGSLL